MPKFLRFFLIFGSIVCVGLIIVANLFLKTQIHTDEFKAIAQAKVGEFLRAKVELEEIELKFPNRVALKSVVVTDPADDENYQVRINQIVFKYQFWQLLSRNINIPNAITLKSPQLSFGEVNFPYKFFEDLRFASGASTALALSLEGGELRFRIPSVNSLLTLTEVKGTVEPKKSGRIYVEFSALAQGAASGKIEASGFVVPSKREHSFIIDLYNVSLEDGFTVPLQSASGSIRWVNDEVSFEKIMASIHGWQTELNAAIVLSQNPFVAWTMQVGKKNIGAFLNFKADFETQQITGNVRLLGKADHVFRGNITRDNFHFYIEEFIVDESKTGRGELDLINGILKIYSEKNQQRIDIQTNLDSLHFLLKFKLDHVSLYGLDLVTSATMRIAPLSYPNEKNRWKFRGDFETDYFILEYAPFNDFRGSFEIDAMGIRKIQGSWGRVFALEGGVSFASRPFKGKFDVSVDGFDLNQIKEFAAKPLPKDLHGKLDGKLMIDGVLGNPEVIGQFSLWDGKVGRLEFDRGLIQFQGVPPYLALENSKLFRGRTKLYLVGAIDLSLDNMFHGVRLQTSDKIVLWKGWEMNTSAVDGDLQIDRRGDSLPALMIKAGMEAKHPASGEQDYHEDAYIAAGPTLQF